jgi:hypothetical protein
VPRVAASVTVRASLAETWDAYFDPAGWPSWVDGFGTVVELGGGYPAAGGSLRWRSVPAGRGEVGERVLEHEPRRRHRVSFADPAMAGELATSFEIRGEETWVGQELEYRLLDPGPIARLAGVLFVKAQVRASLERSLAAFKREAEERAALAAADAR